jgi:hypothetical protein
MVEPLSSERGIAVVIALLMLGMLTLLGLAAMSTSDDEMSIAGNERQEARAFYAAEAGLERAAASIQTEYETTGLPPVTMPAGTETLNSATVTYQTFDDGAATQRTLTAGSLAGLHALVKSFTINSMGKNIDNLGKVQLSQSFEVDLIPIFQFAVFYNNDVEFAPGPDMKLVGRVHSNGNVYIQSDNCLSMDSYLTAAGNIYHGRKGLGGTGTGDVLIKNGSGAYVSMKSASGWLDSRSSTWYDSSIARWNGRVQDKAHGQQALNLPLASGTDPHKVIEPAAGGNTDSYENKATLKFVDNKAFQLVSGSWVDVTAAMTAAGVITYTADKFTDQRENQKVDVTELDIAKMYANGYAPSNGIVYFSDNIAGASEYPALRIKNGSELKAPLTIASANPVYTLGNYNSVNKKPAALLGDAITFLSSAFDDAKSTLSKSNRVAVPTTVNACYLTGDVPTATSYQNGGFQNLPRFLETWNGTEFFWSGSAVCMWDCSQAAGLWAGTYYDPPLRRWSYDSDLDDPAKLPPGTPAVRVFLRTGWQEQFAS